MIIESGLFRHTHLTFAAGMSKLLAAKGPVTKYIATQNSANTRDL